MAELHAGPGDLAPLVERVTRLRAAAGRSGRVLLGIAGAPGAGKSILVAALAEELHARSVGTAVVGMDGFHLAQAELERLGRAARKGAVDTFDAEGYVALLRRVRVQRPGAPVVYAPRFDRALEEPIGSAVPVPADVPVVLTEGNYLLHGDAPWSDLARLLDERWFLVPDEEDRRRRLYERHRAFGRDPAEARAFAEGSDQANAELVARGAARADLIVRWRSAGRGAAADGQRWT
ncbi:nucleoside/nucleotide kinase family protein [Georgenia sp. 10Sc9-8]|uniref:Nucleoside/nucleotide kinase family protein n=1 Tax=Georgenia halotolerans TaxID=3028317 RepID=A0ABT5U0L4_9MICO|nr:nucleoside/nucleotide kinase family protein [Georgenia halotolerans]